ncbi:cysteine desulfurase IscS [Sneathiella chinensis]|uniref:Cysteine desulfurase n=2 Tax=Sneathiella chinensis TaxID=349750 RepID=A0ABQ5U1Z8_9PROT|nr:cysteine desulfurase IscS [Sneathiella chinensis]
MFEGAEIHLPLFLDHQSTTPLAPEVRDTLFQTYEQPGNQDSLTHAFGHAARQTVQKAKRHIAALISAHADEIIFTSGATEANNLALFGLVTPPYAGKQVITTPIEHSSILSPLKEMEKQGLTVTFAAVDGQGRVSLTDLESKISGQTALVTIQSANNEIGTIQPLSRIAALCAAHGVPFHTDAVQAAATEKIDASLPGLTALSLSAHKLYGPQGIGALFIRRGTSLSPTLFGGDQQNSRRPGTLPTALIAGFGTAAKLAHQNRDHDHHSLASLAQRLRDILIQNPHVDVRFNGDPDNRLPGCLSLTFGRIEAEDLILEMPELAISTGSACLSSSGGPSHVLTAIGLSPEEAGRTVRIGLGRYVTETECAFAASIIVAAYERLLKTQ